MGQLSEALKGIPLSEQTRSLVAEADELLAKRFDQAKYVEHLEAEIKRLREEKGISGARDGLTFNNRTGTYTDSAGAHFCTPCLSKEKREPLKVERSGWRCMVCREYFSNPDSPPPVVRTRGGPKSWMAS